MEPIRTHLLSDTFIMFARSFKHVFRSLDTIITVTLMPIARSAGLWGHVLSSLVSNAISVAAIILVTLLMGFRSSAGVLPWLAAIGFLALFTLALTMAAAIAGLSARTMDGAVAFSYPLIFLPFVSSAFVPTESMPKAVRALRKTSRRRRSSIRSVRY